MKIITTAILFLAGWLVSCGSSGERAGNWTRTRDCAAQSEKLRQEEQKQNSSGPVDLASHYSPRYEQCLARLDYYRTNGDHETRLFDPFERTQFAYANNRAKPGDLTCGIVNARESDCSRVFAYLDDRMKR